MNASENPFERAFWRQGAAKDCGSGTSDLKPLVKVAGETLIERVLTSMAEAGATEVDRHHQRRFQDGSRSCCETEMAIRVAMDRRNDSYLDA